MMGTIFIMVIALLGLGCIPRICPEGHDFDGFLESLPIYVWGEGVKGLRCGLNMEVNHETENQCEEFEKICRSNFQQAMFDDSRLYPTPTIVPCPSIS